MSMDKASHKSLLLYPQRQLVSRSLRILHGKNRKGFEMLHVPANHLLGHVVDGLCHSDSFPGIRQILYRLGIRRQNLQYHLIFFHLGNPIFLYRCKKPVIQVILSLGIRQNRKAPVPKRFLVKLFK